MRSINKCIDFLLFILIILFTTAGILISLHRYWQYDVWYYDFGIFARALWNASQFQSPVIDHFIVPGKVIFADHFNPGLFILTPFFWLFPRGETLLVIQALIVGISGYVLYLAGKIVLKNYFLSFAVIVAYFCFTGLQNAVITEFHELTLSALPIAFIYYAVVINRKKLFYLSLFLTLSLKESFFVYGISLSIFLFFYQSNWRKHAFSTLFISLCWGFITMQFIIPFFSGMPYYYTSEFPRSLEGIISSLVIPSIKLKTVFFTLGSFLFIPLMYLPLLPVLIMNFVSRFLAPGSTRWDLGFHYSAEIAPTLAFSSILFFKLISEKSKHIVFYLSIGLIGISLFLYRFVLHGPFALAYNSAFYKHTANFRYLDALIKKVPINATVATQNNLAPKFFMHKNVWILRENYEVNKPEYIVLDLREGQNPNNFLGAKNIQKILIDIQNNKQYRLIFNEADQYVFHRIEILHKNK